MFVSIFLAGVKLVFTRTFPGYQDYYSLNWDTDKKFCRHVIVLVSVANNLTFSICPSVVIGGFKERTYRGGSTGRVFWQCRLRTCCAWQREKATGFRHPQLPSPPSITLWHTGQSSLSLFYFLILTCTSPGILQQS